MTRARSPFPDTTFEEKICLLKDWYQQKYRNPLPVVKSFEGVLVIKDSGGVIFGEKGEHRARLKTNYQARDALERLGFEVLPSTGTGKYLRLRWSPQIEQFSLPSICADLGSARALKRTILAGKVPATEKPEHVQAALRTLYQAAEYECYRQLARDFNRLGIPVPELDGKPFITMVPELKDIEILSIGSCKYRYYGGHKAPSYEVKIKIRDRTVRLVGPDFLDWDVFVSNVRNGLQDLSQSSLLKVVKQVVVDHGSKKGGNAHASARCLIGKINLFRQPDSSYQFTDRVFHHEVGHLIADRVGGIRFLHRIGRRARSATGRTFGGVINKIYRAGHPGRRFEETWKNEGSHTSYGHRNVREGFAEAYADFMVGNHEKIHHKQRSFVAKIGINNTFASNNPKSMNPNLVREGGVGE